MRRVFGRKFIGYHAGILFQIYQKTLRRRAAHFQNDTVAPPLPKTGKRGHTGALAKTVAGNSRIENRGAVLDYRADFGGDYDCYVEDKIAP